MKLRLLVLALSDRCDQRCVHCSIWMDRPDAGPAMTRSERLGLVDEALAAGVRESLLTGGEPLLSADLWPVAARLKGRARLYLATNGMLLEAHAARVASLFDEVYVSLDGASATSHDGLRGVAAFDRVVRGVQAVRRASRGVRVVARSTLHALNLHELEDLVGVTRRAGFDVVSFLPVDARSSSFGGDPAARQRLVPTAAQVEAFESSVCRLESAGAFVDGFVAESAAKLRRLGHHLRASGGTAAFERPACDAPWWSCVVETDGRVRPCFFHAATGDVRQGLLPVLGSEPHRAALTSIRAPNRTCDGCVCPKKRPPALLERITGFWGAA